MDEEQKIFKKGSTAYYYSSRFFPRKIREDIYRLYTFISTANNYANSQSVSKKKLLDLEKTYLKTIVDPSFDAIAHKWDDIDTRAIKHIVRLQHKYKFDELWVKSFFDSMKMNIENKKYLKPEDTLKYTYGSSEVIGFMIAKILKLPDEALEPSAIQARSMQWINFIRNLESDIRRGRCYFSAKEINKYGLKNLDYQTVKDNPDKFKKFIHSQIGQYKKWHKQALVGLEYVPERFQVPIKTVIDLFDWMAYKIDVEPLLVYDKRIRPRKLQVIRLIIRNTARGTARVTTRTSRQAKDQVVRIKPAAKASLPKIKKAPKVIKTKTKELKNNLFE